MAARSRSSSGTQAPKSDAYVGLLLISLLAQIAGVVFFYLDYSAYPEAKPKLPSPPQAVAPAGPGPGVPVAPPAGGMGGAVPPAGGMAGMMGGAKP